MRFFPPAIKTPVWEARMRSLERRCHEEDPLYQVATYLASLDQLFDEQANILREQTHRAEQAELAVRLQQIRAAQAEARAAAAVRSEDPLYSVYTLSVGVVGLAEYVCTHPILNFYRGRSRLHSRRH